MDESLDPISYVTQPVSTLQLKARHVKSLLLAASECSYDVEKATLNPRLELLAEELEDIPANKLPVSEEGYFVRTSHCSTKDVGGGTSSPIRRVKQALEQIVASKRCVTGLLSVFYSENICQLSKAEEDEMEPKDAKLFFFPFVEKRLEYVLLPKILDGMTDDEQ